MLYHYRLIPELNNKMLLLLHAYCCRLRKHDCIMNFKESFLKNYSTKYFIVYHFYVLKELERRHINCNSRWWVSSYRGTGLPHNLDIQIEVKDFLLTFDEFNDVYYKRCVKHLHNLRYSFSNGRYEHDSSLQRL